VRVPTHHGGRRVSAQEVRLVLRHARPYSNREWAAFLGIHQRSLKAWKARGMNAGLWSGPSGTRWNTLKAEAVRNLWQAIKALEATSGR
jgi:hypothetical protein